MQTTLTEVVEILGEPQGHKNTDWDDSCFYWNVHGSEISIATMLNSEPINMDKIEYIDVEYNGYNGEFETLEDLKYFVANEEMKKMEDWI